MMVVSAWTFAVFAFWVLWSRPISDLLTPRYSVSPHDNLHRAESVFIARTAICLILWTVGLILAKLIGGCIHVG